MYAAKWFEQGRDAAKEDPRWASVTQPKGVRKIGRSTQDKAEFLLPALRSQLVELLSKL